MYHYFLLEPSPAGKSINQMDYIAEENLISGRLKDAIEQYLPDLEYTSVEKGGETFWEVNPPSYEGAIEFDGNTIWKVPYLNIINDKTPLVFAIQTPGQKFILIRMAMAESILQKGIFGLKLKRLGRGLE